MRRSPLSLLLLIACVSLLSSHRASSQQVHGNHARGVVHSDEMGSFYRGPDREAAGPDRPTLPFPEKEEGWWEVNRLLPVALPAGSVPGGSEELRERAMVQRAIGRAAMERYLEKHASFRSLDQAREHLRRSIKMTERFGSLRLVAEESLVLHTAAEALYCMDHHHRRRGKQRVELARAMLEALPPPRHRDHIPEHHADKRVPSFATPLREFARQVLHELEMRVSENELEAQEAETEQQRKELSGRAGAGAGRVNPSENYSSGAIAADIAAPEAFDGAASAAAFASSAGAGNVVDAAFVTSTTGGGVGSAAGSDAGGGI